MENYLIVFWLLAGWSCLLLPAGHTHNLGTLRALSEAQNRDLSNYFKDYSRLRDELLKAQGTLQQLWSIDSLSKVLEDSNFSLTEECKESINFLLPDGTSPEVSLARLFPLLDAAGKQEAGLLLGNFQLDGAYDECYNYNYTGYCLVDKVSIQGIPDLKWNVGLCIPKYCTNVDISILINNGTNDILVVDKNTVKCGNTKSPSLSAGAITMLVISSFFVAMVIFGTTLDAIFSQCLPFFLAKEDTSYVITVSANGTQESPRTDTTPLIIHQADKPSNKVSLWEFVMAFSLFKTVPTLLATKQGPSVITCLNGLRVISMFWVILGHSHLWALALGVSNLVFIGEVLSRFTFLPVENGLFSVDSFFFLSGVLVAYLTFREIKRKNGRFPVLHFYVHRYLRLTPTYAFVLFFSWTLTRYLAKSPMVSLYGNTVVGNCDKYWWTNLLYINNLYPWKQDEECFGWAWYLANDMQFFVISPLILIPAYFYLPAALIIVAVLLVCSFVVTSTLVGVFDIQIIYGNNYTGPSSQEQSGDLLYVKPWTRIAPYLVGLILGYILYKGIQLPFSRKKNALIYLTFWIAAGCLLIPDVYGTYFAVRGHVTSMFENILYLSLRHFVWGLGLSFVVYACHNGYGWFINSFLSMNMWIPLSRMTFNAYLVHPVVMSVIYGQLQKSTYYTDITLAFYVIGFVVISYGIAGVLCVFVEFPLGTIETLVFRMVGVKGRRTQRQVIEISEKDETKEKVDA